MMIARGGFTSLFQVSPIRDTPIRVRVRQYGDTAIFKKQGYADTASIYFSKNVNCQIILENEIDNKYYVSKRPT